MTTCPSGVNYMHLVDHGRRHIEEHYRRPLRDRMLRRLLGEGADQPGPAARGAVPGAVRETVRRVRAKNAAPAAGAGAAPHTGGLAVALDRDLSGRGGAAHADRAAARLRAAGAGAGDQPRDDPALDPAWVRGRCRTGQPVLRRADPSSRRGEAGAGPGARQYRRLGKGRGSGRARRRCRQCLGLRHDVEGLRVSAPRRPKLRRQGGADRGLARDVSEIVAALGLRAPTGQGPALRVAYHSACSLQHGQKIDREPKALLAAAGFEVLDVPEGHLCCGSAGTYNILQPELAAALRDRKLANIALTRPDVVAAGNIGCITQLGGEEARCRSCIRSNCSTGRPAAPRRRGWPGAGRRSSRRIGAFSSLPNYRIRSARIDSGEGAVAVRWVLTDDRALALAAKLSAEIRTAVRHRPAG